MKIWRTLVLAVLLGSATGASAWFTDVLCGLEISAEYIYWKPFNSVTFWGQLQGNDAFQRNLRSELYIGADYQSGVGVAARYRFPCSCWSAMARYHWVRPTGSAQYVLELPFTSQFAITTRPANVQGTRVVSEIRVPYHAVEGLLGYNFVCGRCVELNVLAGATFFSFQQNYSDRLVFPAPLRRPGCLFAKFAGAGPAIGLSGLARLCAGFRISGELLLTGVIGRKKNGSLTVIPSQVIQVQFPPVTGIVPGLICRLGAGWQQWWCDTLLSVDLGWEQRSYLEVTTIPPSSQFDTTIDDVHIAGPYLGASVRF